MAETLPEILRRVALEHTEQKTQEYFQKLEAIAQAAKITASDPKLEQVKGGAELKAAIAQLNAA